MLSKYYRCLFLSSWLLDVVNKKIIVTPFLNKEQINNFLIYYISKIRKLCAFQFVIP